MSNLNEENIPFTKKQYLNLANKAVDALLLSHLSNTRTNKRNLLTYRDILNLKNAIKSERSRSNFRLNFPARNKNIFYNGNINKGPPASIGWNIYKTHPNGSKTHYTTGAINNGLPINLKKINAGFFGRTGPKVKAAIKIQRAWRNKRKPGPFANPVIQSLVPKIIGPLPKSNKQSFLGSFRPSTKLNKEMIERSKGVNKYWSALLTNIQRQSVLRGSPHLLSRKEYQYLYNTGPGKIHFVPGSGMRIPPNMRNSAWQNVLKLRKSPKRR